MKRIFLLLPVFIFTWVSTSLFAQTYDLKLLVSKLKYPVYLTQAPGKGEDFYIVEQKGRIRRWRRGKLERGSFLDIRHKVKSGGERGLLGLAFHPKYKENRKFYLNYTYKKGKLRTRISEFRVSKKGVALLGSERVILEVDQPYGNHNAGQIEFGPDGYLYIGLGDGGAGGDPYGNGQNLSTLLGSMLRIDVNGLFLLTDPKQSYAIPKDNPFVKKEGARGEIWAYGLRNPWRFSFDQKTGDLYVADVGQDEWEEINILQKGKNYGWNIMEGNHCYPPSNKGCQTRGLVRPIDEYHHKLGNSVTGGYVYRGKSIPSLVGYYLYADYGSGRIWAIRYDGKRLIDKKEILKTKYAISSFGQDASGEVYVIDYAGDIYKLVVK